MSEAEEILALHLRSACIGFVREHRFAPPRRWRFDFVIGDDGEDVSDITDFIPEGCLAIEVEGGAFTGGHKRGVKADTDCEKANAAAIAGWTVLRFTPRMVNDGTALATIQRAIGKEAA